MRKIIILWMIIPVLSIQAGRTIHVAKNGNDTYPGTASKPFLTINHAAQLALAGDTVLVNEGLYRETVKPKNSGSDEAHRIVYLAKPGAKVVVKGSEEINTWKRYKNKVWRVVLPNTFFGDYNPYTTQHPFWNAGKFFAGYTCGDVYLNEEAYCQKDTLEKLQNTPNTWYAEVDDNNTTIYANFGSANPNAELAEINVRHQVIAPEVWGLAYITIDGFTVKHSANWYSDFPSPVRRRQAGAISVYGGLKWIIQNNTVINARSIGIDIGLGCDQLASSDPEVGKTSSLETDKYGSHIVRNNYIAKCGQSGIAGVYSWNSQVLYNQIEDNNYRNEFSGAETAPIKLHYCNYGLIKGNYIHNSKGWNSGGIWTDWGNQGMRITCNIVINCPWGYFGEAVHGPVLVDNNIFIGNKDIYLSDATGILLAHNLFVNNGKVDIHGKGRVCAYYEPGTMKLSGALSFPQLFYWFNNVFSNTTFPQNEEGKTHIQAGNDTTAISNFQYIATTQEVSISFDYNGHLSEKILPVTKERIGIIPKSNERIPVDVDTDFFGNPIEEKAVRVGPFQNCITGKNTFKLFSKNK